MLCFVRLLITNNKQFTKYAFKLEIAVKCKVNELNNLKRDPRNKKKISETKIHL